MKASRREHGGLPEGDDCCPGGQRPRPKIAATMPSFNPVSSPLPIGGATIGMINGIVLTFAALAFLFDLGEEIAADAMDVIGDEQRSSKSIAKRKNKIYALRLSCVIFIIFIIRSFLPFLMGWLGYVYLLLILVTDLAYRIFPPGLF